MLDFNEPSPVESPTERQRRYAAVLGIEVPPDMSKEELSAAIAHVERMNPDITEQREKAKALAREKKFGKELIAIEAQWNRFAEEVGYLLAVYTRRKETIVDVLQVNEAFIDDNGKLKLCVESPKIVKDRHIGKYLEWDRYFELPVTSLLYYESVKKDLLDADGILTYRKAVERGLEIARQM